MIEDQLSELADDVVDMFFDSITMTEDIRKYFPKNYLEKEQKRKELEMKIASALKKHDVELAKKLCENLDK